jgi:hypothetical protein
MEAVGKTLEGVILLGTPHRGSPSEKWGSKLARAAAVLGLGQENALIDTREESAEIRDLVQEFAWAMIGADMCKARRVVIFFENKKSDYGRRLQSWLPGIKWEDIVGAFRLRVLRFVMLIGLAGCARIVGRDHWILQIRLGC